MIAGAGDPPPSSVNIFLHGDSPSSGEYWESQSLISFDKLKLTNNRSSIMHGQICLHSMHKYVPRIHIKELDEVQANAIQRKGLIDWKSSKYKNKLIKDVFNEFDFRGLRG